MKETIHTLKKGWFPDHTSTTYRSLVPLTVKTSSPLQITCVATTMDQTLGDLSASCHQSRL